MPQPTLDAIDTTRDWLQQARRIAVLSGAGISAESGVPTFRDAQTGLWARFNPAELATEEAFRADPERVWNWYAFRRELTRAAQPNAAHVAIAQFQQRHPGRLTVITQNVDGLHQRAGSQGVLALHGNLIEDRWLDAPRDCCHAQHITDTSPTSYRRAASPAATRAARPWFGLANTCLRPHSRKRSRLRATAM